MKPSPYPHHQTGSATLLITLVLSMSITLVTLSVANTQLTEYRLSANNHWHTRLALQAQSSWNTTVANLIDDFGTLEWLPAEANDTVSNQTTYTAPDNSTQTTIHRVRPDAVSRFIDIQATSGRNDGSLMQINHKQTVRILTVMAPQMETPAPLILNGCLTSAAARIDIRPLNSDTDTAGDAIWIPEGQTCPALAAIDLHSGSIVENLFEQSLWSDLFSVSVEDFIRMAAAELDLPIDERRYWYAEASNPAGTRWTQSLGNSTQPVVLYFPLEFGCPQFADGVQIFGIVFIDTACANPIAEQRLEIFGALVVNGNLNAGNADIILNHIQTADVDQLLLDFPVLRSVKVPGSWRDF